jgi:hypothetical protein
MARFQWLIVMLLVTWLPDASAQYAWSPGTPIDTTYPGGQLGGYMALDDSGSIYVTWAGFVGIFVERSTDRGLTWTRNIYTGPELARTPRDIVVDHNGVVWLLWISVDDEFAPMYVNLSRSSDSGQTFTRVFRSLSYADGFVYQKLAVDAQNSLYMLWDDQSFTLTKFRHGEISQRTNAFVPHGSLQIQGFPNLLVTDDFAVHCVWNGQFTDTNSVLHDYIFYSPSSDTGLTINTSVRIDTVDNVGNVYVHAFPSTIVDQNSVIRIVYTRNLQGGAVDIRMARSDNGGTTFKNRSLFQDASWSTAMLVRDSPANGINLIYRTFHSRSTNGGLTFENPVHFPIGPHTLKDGGDGFLYASGELNQKVCFSWTNVLTNVGTQNSIPNKTVLCQNFPNPFNSSTEIRFVLPEAATVSLTVFDLLGRRIAELADGRYATGSYTAIWNASEQASGIYFARLTAIDPNRGMQYTKVNKLVLMK